MEWTQCFRILLGILSYPVEFFGLRDIIIVFKLELFPFEPYYQA